MGKSCWDCIHCDVCANIDGFSRHVSDVSKCKHFKSKADVEPVRRAEWIRNSWNDYSCSSCHTQYAGYGALRWGYCPDCGAKMDGKEVQE